MHRPRPEPRTSDHTRSHNENDHYRSPRHEHGRHHSITPYGPDTPALNIAQYILAYCGTREATASSQRRRYRERRAIGRNRYAHSDCSTRKVAQTRQMKADAKSTAVAPVKDRRRTGAIVAIEILAMAVCLPVEVVRVFRRVPVIGAHDITSAHFQGNFDILRPCVSGECQ